MGFIGRSEELGRLRGSLDARVASVVGVTGVRGAGKSALVRHVLTDFDHLVLRVPPLPDPLVRAEIMARVTAARNARGWSPHVEEDVPVWDDLMPGLLSLARPSGRPVVVVLDDVHRLGEARARWLPALTEVIERARGEGRPLHVVLVGPRSAMPEADDLPPDCPDPIVVGPLPLRVARTLLPGSRPVDMLRAYGVFGGIPSVLASIDRDVALGTNLRRVVLSAGGALNDTGGRWLEREVQAPARYYAVLRALAEGEVDWAGVHAGVPDLTRSGQLAPYLKKLEELGLVTSRRSLDATPASRSRRYALADPFLATWMRFAFPGRHRAAEQGDQSGRAFATVDRGELDAHVATAFPRMCRQHMRYDAIETVGANARESGSLWGADYDIPVAGILTSGWAYYGSCEWSGSEAGRDTLTGLDRQLRETRYGFGRQARIRIVFTASTPPPDLQREIARRHDAELIDANALVGDG